MVCIWFIKFSTKSKQKMPSAARFRWSFNAQSDFNVRMIPFCHKKNDATHTNALK